MKITTLFASLFLVLALAGHARAGDNPYEPGGITVWTPDDWQTKVAGDDKGAMLFSANADNTAGVIVTVVDAKDVKKANKMLKKLLAPHLTKAKMSKAKVVDLNGMKGYESDGKAKQKATGKKVGVMTFILETPTHKALLFIAVAEEDSFAANKDTLLKIIQGVKPL